MGDLGAIPGLGRSPAGGHGNPLQNSCVENPHRQRSLGDYSAWGHKESDITEQLSTVGGGAQLPNPSPRLLVLSPVAECALHVGTKLEKELHYLQVHQRREYENSVNVS